MVDCHVCGCEGEGGSVFFFLAPVAWLRSRCPTGMQTKCSNNSAADTKYESKIGYVVGATSVADEMGNRLGGVATDLRVVAADRQSAIWMELARLSNGGVEC